MGQSKKSILTISEMFEWLASTGNLFPSNSLELTRFEKLYEDFNYKLSEDCVDPFAIVNGTFRPQRIVINWEENQQINKDVNEDMRMAARNFNTIPDHILKKLKRNQDGYDSKEKGSKDKSD